MASELGDKLEGSELNKSGLDNLNKTDAFEKAFESDRNVDQASIDDKDLSVDREKKLDSELLSSRELTDSEKSEIKADFPGRSDNVLDHTRVDENGNEIIKTINSELEGTELLDSNGEVAGHYEQQTIDEGNGRTLTGVFAHFDHPLAEVKLPLDKEYSANSVQFNECNHQLSEQLEKDPSLKQHFTSEQLADLKNSTYNHPTITGLVWHHQPEKGQMVLVDSVAHHNAHTGGNALWGGGTDGAKTA